MPHPLVTQLHFARSEFVRCLEGVSDEDARRRLLPMNCLSWIIGHMANQEHGYWVIMAQERSVVSGLNELVGFGKPASTPPLAEMWDVWRTVTTAADSYLETLDSNDLQSYLLWRKKPLSENVGVLLMRNIYHYWFHTGEAHAIRQMLGHTDLPQFVGDIPQVSFLP